MKEIKSLALSLGVMVVLGVGMGGCATPEIYYNTEFKQSKKVVYLPALNTESKAEVGDNMFSKSYLHTDSNTYVITLLEDAPMPVFGVKFDLHSGHKELLSKWKGNNAICFYPNSLTYHCLLDTDNSGFFTFHGAASVPNQYRFEKPIKYKIDPNIGKNISDGSFKYQALYQGKIDNKIKISFREFIDNMARPSFAQDVEYQLDKDGGTLVGFKGLRIKVIKATNTDIMYSVIQDYN